MRTYRILILLPTLTVLLAGCAQPQQVNEVSLAIISSFINEKFVLKLKR